jgi:hypothetical protein
MRAVAKNSFLVVMPGPVPGIRVFIEKTGGNCEILFVLAFAGIVSRALRTLSERPDTDGGD